MHCPECHDGVCEQCLPAYDNVGFAMFLCHENRESLSYYGKDPSNALALFRSPWLAPVFHLHEEFKNTDGHRRHLAKWIEQGEKDLVTLRYKYHACSFE